MFNAVTLDQLPSSVHEHLYSFLSLFDVERKEQVKLASECKTSSDVLNLMFKTECGQGGKHRSEASKLKGIVTAHALKAHYGDQFELYPEVIESQDGAKEGEVFAAHDEIHVARNVHSSRCDAYFLDSKAYISPFRFDFDSDPIYIMGKLNN